MAEYLITMREYNEASNSYDILYPNTVKENIKDLENLGGARIDVAIVGGAAGQVVNLSGAKTATVVTDTTGIATFDNLQYGEYLVSINNSGATKTQNITIDALKIYEISRQKKKEIINLMRKAKLLNLSNFVVKEQK